MLLSNSLRQFIFHSFFFFQVVLRSKYITMYMRVPLFTHYKQSNGIVVAFTTVNNVDCCAVYFQLKLLKSLWWICRSDISNNSLVSVGVL